MARSAALGAPASRSSCVLNFGSRGERLQGAALRTLPLLTVLLLAACSGGGGTTDPVASGSFTISLGPEQLYPGDQTRWIKPGESEDIELRLTRTGGFAGSVAITVQGLPAGVTAAPLTISSGADSGFLILNAGSNATLGVATLTIRATAAGVAERTLALGITVDPDGIPAGFGLGLSPNFLAIEQGTMGATTVTVIPGTEARPITLSAVGLPGGVTASFSPALVTGGTPSTLTLTASGGAALGAAVVEIRGTTPGVALQTVNLPIEVIAPGAPPPGGPGSVTWDFCADSGIPIWVAVQQAGSTDPWTRIFGTGDRYGFDLDFGRGGVAWVVPTGQGGFELNVFYGTVAEIKELGKERCGENPGGGKTVTGTVTGFGAGIETAFLRLGGRSPDVAPTSLTPDFTFSQVREGPVDLIGGLMPAGAGGTGAPTRFLIQRNLSPAPGSSLAAVNFQGAGSFAPEVRSVTVGNHGGEAVTTVTMLRTGHAFGVIAAHGAAPDAWYGVPAGQLQPGELHLVSVTAVHGSHQQTRSVQQMVGSPASLSLELKAPIGTITAGRLERRHPRLTVPLDFNTDYNRYWVGDFQQAPNWRAQVQMTTGYRGNAGGNLRLEIPQGLFAAAGWDPAWEPTGGAMTGTVSLTGWAGGAGTTTPLWEDGNRFWSATRIETIPAAP